VILAALRIASDIERIGDYAANVAKRSMALNLLPPLPPRAAWTRAGRLAAGQVREVLDAYRARDAEARCGSAPATPNSTRCTPACSASC
jgi:phosphate transport system protein